MMVDNHYLHILTVVIISSVDVDECTVKTDSCSPNAVCTNTDGTFSCACNEGFSGNGADCEGETTFIKFVS